MLEGSWELKFLVFKEDDWRRGRYGERFIIGLLVFMVILLYVMCVCVIVVNEIFFYLISIYILIKYLVFKSIKIGE